MIYFQANHKLVEGCSFELFFHLPSVRFSSFSMQLGVPIVLARPCVFPYYRSAKWNWLVNAHVNNHANEAKRASSKRRYTKLV